MKSSRKEIEAELNRASKKLTEAQASETALKEEASTLASQLSKEQLEVEKLNSRVIELTRDLRKASEERASLVTLQKQTLDEEKKARKELEEEKRNLIVECQKLNDMASAGSVAQGEIKRQMESLKEEKEQVDQMLSRHKDAALQKEQEMSEELAQLQQEIEQMAKEKQQSILLVNNVQTELKMTKKLSQEKLNKAQMEVDRAKEENRQILLKVEQGKSLTEAKLSSIFLNVAVVYSFSLYMCYAYPILVSANKQKAICKVDLKTVRF